MKTKTSQAIRDAVDKCLGYDRSVTYDGVLSPYLCDVFRDVDDDDEIRDTFITPDVKGWDLFRHLSDTCTCSDEEFARRQGIRFIFAEIIACHYESIGD